MRAFSWLFRLAACCFGGLASAADSYLTTEVDLLLVLAADVSKSMSLQELQLQRDGYIAAFQHPDVAAAIQSGPLGRIAVTYVEWAGLDDQVVVIPWTVLAGEEGMARFAARLAAAPVRRGVRTALSSGLLFSALQFSATGMRSNRRTIDVSGDGIGLEGPPIAGVRGAIVGAGITINGLSMVLPASGRDGPFADMFEPDSTDVHAYYRHQVIGGPGSFAIAVDGLGDFAAAIRRKLVLEIASR